MTVREVREILVMLPDDMEIELNTHNYPFRELTVDRMAIYCGALILNLETSYAFSVPLEEYLNEK